MKIYTYLALFFFVCLSLIPPIDVVITNPTSNYWLWMVMIAGFLGAYTLFIKTTWPVRVIAISGFIHCFFSAVPFISFTSYVSLVACCYFYILCTKIQDWNIIFKAGQAIVILNILIMCLQFFHKDILLNFGNSSLIQFGTIGYHMWMASFGVILGALLIQFNDINLVFPFFVAAFCNSSWTFLCAAAGVSVYLFIQNPKIFSWILVIFVCLFLLWAHRDGKIYSNMDNDSGRAGIWKKSIELANERPLRGWGIGTYKSLFFPLSRLYCMPWNVAHNFIIQLCFEIGYPLTGGVLFGLGWLSFALFKSSQWSCLSGLTMIIMDALVHFPDRMMQTVPIIIVFLAYCTFCLRKEKECQSYSIS